MFCPKCGIETPDDSQFCRKCGNALTGTGKAPTVSTAPVKATGVRQSLVVGLLLALGVFGWLIVQSLQQQKRAASQTQAVPAVPQLRLYTTPFNSAITVRAASFYYASFILPQGSSNVRLQGHFTAMGGSGNDVEVFLLNEDEFTNWKNGHQTSAIYNSGKVTQDSPNVNLPTDAGTYYLVFNNRFSLLTPKAVQANLNFTYYHL